jgi:uncharacterized protein with PIN domain
MRFIADEMLGKLARWLRMAGFDVAYARQISDATLLKQAREEGRLLLTRDTRLIRRIPAAEYLFISKDHLPEQVREFFLRFPELRARQEPLSRCVECNALLVTVEKEAVKDKLWPYVYKTQEHFTTCPSCHRIYWEATHVKKIREKLGSLM